MEDKVEDRRQRWRSRERTGGLSGSAICRGMGAMPAPTTTEPTCWFCSRSSTGLRLGVDADVSFGDGTVMNGIGHPFQCVGKNRRGKPGSISSMAVNSALPAPLLWAEVQQSREGKGTGDWNYFLAMCLTPS